MRTYVLYLPNEDLPNKGQAKGPIRLRPYTSQAYFIYLGRWTILLGFVDLGALAHPTFGFCARPQIPLARTRAVGPRVRDLYVGVAPDLCISSLTEIARYGLHADRKWAGRTWVKL